MHHDVRVATDGRREVRVQRDVERVVAILEFVLKFSRAKILRKLHETFTEIYARVDSFTRIKNSLHDSTFICLEHITTSDCSILSLFTPVVAANSAKDF